MAGASMPGFTDIVSGAKTERPGLTQALKYLRAGNTLVARPHCSAKGSNR